MSFFSSLIKAIFIISLAFPLYSETAYPRPKPLRKVPDCSMYEDPDDSCTGEHDPICTTKGITYYNPCFFCTEMIKSDRTFGFAHFGNC